MVDTTWNRLNLMLQQGEFGGIERSHLLLNSGLDAFNMELACLTRIDNDKLTVIFSSNKDWHLNQFPINETLCKFTLEHRDVLASHNLSDADWDEYGVNEHLRFGAYIGMPVYVQEHLYGTLFFASTGAREEEFSARDEAFLKIMASTFRSIIHHHTVA